MAVSVAVVVVVLSQTKEEEVTVRAGSPMSWSWRYPRSCFYSGKEGKGTKIRHPARSVWWNGRGRHRTSGLQRHVV